MSGERMKMEKGGNSSFICSLMSVCNFALAWQNSMLLLTLPWVIENIGLGTSEVGWILGVSAVFVGLGAVVSGMVSDLWGRGPLLLFSFSFLCLALLLHVWVGDLWQLVILRACAGFATGIAVGIPGTIVSDAVGDTELKRKTGSSIVGYMAGQTIATPLGLLLVYFSGYKPVFVVMSLFMAVLWGYLLVWLRRIRACQPNDGVVIHNFWRSLLGDLKQFQVSALFWVYLLSFAGSSLFFSYFPTWLKFDLDYSLYEFSGLYFLGGCMQIVVILISRSGSTSRISSKSLILLSLLMQSGLIVAVYWLAGASIATCLVFSVSMAALSVRILPLQLYVLGSGDPCFKGMRMGIVNTVSQLGRSLGGIVAGVLLAGAIPSFVALLLSAVLLILSAGIVRGFVAFEMKLDQPN